MRILAVIKIAKISVGQLLLPLETTLFNELVIESSIAKPLNRNENSLKNNQLKLSVYYLKDPCESSCRSHSGNNLINLSCDCRGNDSNISGWKRVLRSSLVSSELSEWNRAFFVNCCSSNWIFLLDSSLWFGRESSVDSLLFSSLFQRP